MANMEILNAALDAIKANPDKHWQGDWVSGDNFDDIRVKADNGDAPPCGTKFCMAGWIAFQNAPSGSLLVNGSMRIHQDDDRPLIPNFARDVAGLTTGQARALFYSANKREELTAMVTHLANNPYATRKELCEAAGFEYDDRYDDNDTDDLAYV